MIEKFSPIGWTLFVSYEGADKLKSIIQSRAWITFSEYEDVVDGEYGVRYELVAKPLNITTVREDDVDSIINEYMRAAE
jgi:hypothetical protein